MKKLIFHRYSSTLFFCISLFISLYYFYHVEDSRLRAHIKDVREEFSIVTNLIISSITSSFFQDDFLYKKIHEERNYDNEEINDYYKKISELNKYVESIEIMELESSVYSNYHERTLNNNVLLFNFKIFNGMTGDFIDGKCLQIKIDASLILQDIQNNPMFIFSTSPSGLDFIYDLKVISLYTPMKSIHIFISLIIALLIALIFQRIKISHSHFFYEQRGLEKIIFLFEKTEKYSANHSRRVSEISTFIGRKYGLKGKRLKDLRVAALLHDIGKISIPVNILNKRGEININEYEIIKNHPIYSANIIANFEELAHLKEIVLYHHEKIDGSGYPSGLMKEEIPIESRIISVADIFEALIGERPYRVSVEPNEAILIMKKMSLDSDILELLIANLEEIQRIYASYNKEYNGPLISEKRPDGVGV